MPRKSAEARAGEAWRAKLVPAPVPPPPPPDLSPAARALWRRIVKSKPADRFDAADLPLLRQLVVLSVQSVAVENALAAADVNDDAAPRLERRLRGLAATCAGLAAKLRLTPHSRIDRRAAELTKGAGPAADRLLGGRARPWC